MSKFVVQKINFCYANSIEKYSKYKFQRIRLLIYFLTTPRHAKDVNNSIYCCCVKELK